VRTLRPRCDGRVWDVSLITRSILWGYPPSTAASGFLRSFSSTQGNDLLGRPGRLEVAMTDRGMLGRIGNRG
jgi:hypothetical protein